MIVCLTVTSVKRSYIRNILVPKSKQEVIKELLPLSMSVLVKKTTHLVQLGSHFNLSLFEVSSLDLLYDILWM